MHKSDIDPTYHSPGIACLPVVRACFVISVLKNAAPRESDRGRLPICQRRSRSERRAAEPRQVIVRACPRQMWFNELLSVLGLIAMSCWLCFRNRLSFTVASYERCANMNVRIRSKDALRR